MRISVAIRKTREEIYETLNRYGIPIDVMDMLMNEIGRNVHKQAEEAYAKDLEEERMVLEQEYAKQQEQNAESAGAYETELPFPEVLGDDENEDS